MATTKRKFRWQDINWLWIALMFTALYVTAVVWVVGWTDIRAFFTKPETELNAIGDFLSGTFAPIAVVWLVAGVLTQRTELGDAREQFAKNQEVIDAQLDLLGLQHAQAVENAGKAYKLSLFDKRFEIYDRFIAFGVEHREKLYDDWSYRNMIKLSHEASFVFDSEIADWFKAVAEEIFQSIDFRNTNPFDRGNDGFGNDAILDNAHNAKLQGMYRSQKSDIDRHFHLSHTIGRFSSYMYVSDQPLSHADLSA